MGVHEPRTRLRPAARRGAGARIRDRIADQRADDGRGIARARGRARAGTARPAAGQLRRLDARAAGPLVDDARAAARATGAARGPHAASRGAAALRAADRPRRGIGVCAQPDRPFLHLPQPQPVPGGPLLDRGQARGRGRVHRSGLPVRVAAAGLLGRRRPRSGSPLRPRDHVLRGRQRLGRGRADARRQMGRAAAHHAGVLRRLQGAAVGLARVGDVRPVGRVPGDRRTREGHDAQLPRLDRGARGQRRAAARAGPDARDRRRGDRPVRRLRGDARRHASADPPAVRGCVRVAPAGAPRARDRRDRSRRRARAPHPRRGRPAFADRGVPRDRPGAVPHGLRPPGGGR